MINPTLLATARREGVYQDGKVLLTNFDGSEQQVDLDATLGRVKGAVDQYARVKANIKPEPWAQYKESGDASGLMFDFNWWPIPDMGGEPEQYNDVFIYQVKGCNLGCDFCFVDRPNNNGKPRDGAKYFSTEEVVDFYLEKRDELGVNVLRASGGEPSLAPEHWLAVLGELADRGFGDKVYFQTDTNLTTGHAIEQWIKDGQLPSDVLCRVADFDNFGLLSCFKGTDPANFSANTGAKPEFFDEQAYSFGKFFEAGINIYPHLINPNPETLEGFMETLMEEFGEEILAMTHVFSLGMYGPVRDRFEVRGLDPDAVQAEWTDNSKRAEEILDTMLHKHVGVGYKETHRPDLMEKW